MALKLRCSACGHVYTIDAKFAGKKVKCKCGKFFLVPGTATATPQSGGAKEAASKPVTPKQTTASTKRPQEPATVAAKRPAAGKTSTPTKANPTKPKPTSPAAPQPTAAHPAPLATAQPVVNADPFAIDSGSDPFSFGVETGSGGGDVFDFDMPGPAAVGVGGGFAPPGGGFPAAQGTFQAAPAAAPAAGQFASAYSPAPQQTAAPKKAGKPMNWKPLLTVLGAIGGILAAAGLVMGFMYWNSSPTSFATPEACFTEYQNATRNRQWSKQLGLLTPEVQEARIAMAARAALPWCKNGPELVAMFAKHGLPDLANEYRQWETDSESDGPRDEKEADAFWKKVAAAREKIESQIASVPPDKGAYYQDLLDTIVEFETRFESNGLYRVNAQRKKKQGRDFVSKNKLQNVEVNGDTAVGHIIVIENREEVDHEIKFKKIGESWRYDTADSLDYLIQIEVRSQSMT
ncbi:MAG: hypothetical protein R3C05_02430 [Pirellulaceae bacterium]